MTRTSSIVDSTDNQSLTGRTRVVGTIDPSGGLGGGKKKLKISINSNCGIDSFVD